MTQDEIIEMAKQADWPDSLISPVIMAKLNDFAKLVAQHEREACAKLVQDCWMAFSRAPNSRLDITPFPELEYVAKVIRARGQE